MNWFDVLEKEVRWLADLDLNQISYPHWTKTIWGVSILILLILLKWQFSRNKSSQKYSGYFIADSYRQGFSSRLINLVFRTILAFGSCLFLVALAEPFVPITKTEVVFRESRERIELIDVSTSKGWLFENTGRPAGQLGREAHLKFFEMRQGKKDRVALWLFSLSAFKVEDFIADDELYYQQVEDAPYVITDPYNPWLPKNSTYWPSCHVLVPENRLNLIDGEGGTFLDVGLRAVIKDFDIYGDKRIKKRAVIVETDAAVDTFPQNELQELQKRKIGLYFLHIKPKVECERLAGKEYLGLENSEKLKMQIKQYGGKFYDITDRNSLSLAYHDIDKLETVEFQDTHHINKLSLFQVFIFWGILLAAGSVFCLVLAEIFGVYP